MIISNGSSTATRTPCSPEAATSRRPERGNLPLVWGHDYKQIPIGRVTQVWTRRRRQHPRGMDMAGERSARRPRQKRVGPGHHHQRLASGSIPKDSVRNKDGGFDHRAWELLEVSLCVVPSNREAVRELKALGLWPDRKAPMHAEEIDITPEQLRQIPGLVRDSVNAEFQKVLAPRPDEVDDAEVRRFLREDFPGDRRRSRSSPTSQNEVALGVRRAAGRLD